MTTASPENVSVSGELAGAPFHYVLERTERGHGFGAIRSWLKRWGSKGCRAIAAVIRSIWMRPRFWMRTGGRRESKWATPAKGLNRVFRPLLAVLEEAKLVAQFWLRAGNAPCNSNVVAFTLELLSNLPHHIRLRLVRADSGFCEEGWLSLLESRRLALHRGLGAALQTADTPAQGNDLATERGAGHRNGGDDLPRGALEPGAAAHFDPASLKRENPRRWPDAAGLSRLSLPGAGDQPARKRLAPCSLARLQRPRWSGKCDRRNSSTALVCRSSAVRSSGQLKRRSLWPW